MEAIILEVVGVFIFLIIWAILVPCSLIVATPVVLVVAVSRKGGFLENSQRYYQAIVRHVGGLVDRLRKWRL